MNQDNGGIIGKLNTPTTTVASGVWTLQDQFEAQTSSIWPLAFPQITFTNSVRMDGDQSDDSLSRSISGVSTTKFSLSFWTKYAAVQGIGSEGPILFSSENNSSDYITFQFNTSNQIDFSFQGTQNRRITNRVFRDPSAFYHFLVVIDTTESTASDRLKIYVNGSQETSFATSTTNVSQSANISPIDETLNYSIGRYNGQSSDFCYDGYFSEFIAVYGQALTPSSFGVFNTVSNIWEPRGYAGTYGTNGFRLNFSDSSNLGDDTSGNGNDFTVNNLTSIDQSTDTPSNNFCIFNPVDIPANSSGSTGTIHDLSDGNLTLTNTNSAFREARSTFYLTQGKWYWEAKSTREGGSQSQVGVVLNNYSGGSGQRRVYQHNAKKYDDGGSSDYGATWTTNDIIGVALNLDDGEITFYKNGSSQGVAFTDLLTSIDDTGWIPTFNSYNGDMSFNFGSPPYAISSGNADANGFGNFEYAVPSGYFSLCTKNLAEFG